MSDKFILLKVFESRINFSSFHFRMDKCPTKNGIASMEGYEGFLLLLYYIGNKK